MTRPGFVTLLCVGGLNAGGYVEINEAAALYEFKRLKPDAENPPVAILSTTAYHAEVAMRRDRESCTYIRHTFRGAGDTIDVLGVNSLSSIDVIRELSRGYKP